MDLEERSGLVVEPQTPERDVGVGSSLGVSCLCT